MTHGKLEFPPETTAQPPRETSLGIFCYRRRYLVSPRGWIREEKTGGPAADEFV